MTRPSTLPIGLALNAAARVVGRTFDDALQQAGGSLPTWRRDELGVSDVIVGATFMDAIAPVVAALAGR